MKICQAATGPVTRANRTRGGWADQTAVATAANPSRFVDDTGAHVGAPVVPGTAGNGASTALARRAAVRIARTNLARVTAMVGVGVQEAVVAAHVSVRIAGETTARPIACWATIRRNATGRARGGSAAVGAIVCDAGAVA